MLSERFVSNIESRNPSFETSQVRERLEHTFGPGALERTPACLGICPRVKMALAYAVDHADGHPVTDEHILLGMLSVPDCVAARVLTEPDLR